MDLRETIEKQIQFLESLQEFCRKPRPCRAGMNARVETENQV